MATYITLIRYTEDGIKNIKDGPSRLDAAREAFKAAGAELKEFYLTFGQYDAVSIIDCPDDATATRLALMIGAQGAVRTETMRAHPEGEYREIIASLP